MAELITIAVTEKEITVIASEEDTATIRHNIIELGATYNNPTNTLTIIDRKDNEIEVFNVLAVTIG